MSYLKQTEKKISLSANKLQYSVNHGDGVTGSSLPGLSVPISKSEFIFMD